MGELTLEDLRAAEWELIKAHRKGDQDEIALWARRTQNIYAGLSDEQRAEHAAATAI